MTKRRGKFCFYASSSSLIISHMHFFTSYVKRLLFVCPLLYIANELYRCELAVLWDCWISADCLELWQMEGTYFYQISDRSNPYGKFGVFPVSLSSHHQTLWPSHHQAYHTDQDRPSRHQNLWQSATPKSEWPLPCLISNAFHRNKHL